MKLSARCMAAAACLLVFAAVAASPAAADVPQNGWGFAIADDDYIGDPNLPHAFGSGFALLRPKTFRFQIYWDADSALIAKARAVIERVRSVGVQQVLVTFKEHGADLPPPSPGAYSAGITNVVAALDDVVDVWGPANEPNEGERWLPLPNGPVTLAAYNQALIAAVAQHDPTALRTSPDFVDTLNTATFSNYVQEYLAAGGGWGHYVAFHPYKWINRKINGQLAPGLGSVDELASIAPASKPIWITEIGAAGRAEGYNDPPQDQNYRVNWMAVHLRGHDRVERIYYYHLRGKSSGFDTALADPDLNPRLAWRSWCAASHSNQYSHPDCTSYPTVDTLGIHNSAGGNCLANTNDANAACNTFFIFGEGDHNQIIAGDWNGDGIDTLGIHNSAGGNCLANTNDANATCNTFFIFGEGDHNQIIAGDWNGDGIDTLGVHSDAGGNCLINTNATNSSCDLYFPFGGLGDKAVVGDWNRNGIDTLGVHNDAGGNCLINTNSTNGSCDIYFTFGGGSHNQVIAGDWVP